MNGKAIAMTVAGLLLAVAPRVGHADDKTKEAKVKCSGVNACKGKGGCAGASNSCSGQNGCKGKGWVETSAKECKDKKGTVMADKDAKDKAPVKK
ncbi:MAG TPA: hypothetical protein VHW23_05000 [Kofleriaceae bacterium]|nr:hypothetical protein [Kofleriaceae bacterium]